MLIVSKTTAYRVIKRLNAELKEKNTLLLKAKFQSITSTKNGTFNP